MEKITDRQEENEAQTTQRAAEPPKNLTPEEQALIERGSELATQFEKEMYLIDTIFTVMTMLEILVDVLTFYDLQKDDDWFDAGTFAGKGLVNASFTTFYLIRDNFLPPKEDADVIDSVDI